jgi:nicotinamidase-related amidase
MRPANEALIVIDIQNDFCPGGALAVAGGDDIVAPVNALMRDYRVRVLTQDWHPAGHSSFASSHPGRDPFAVIDMPYGPQVLWPRFILRSTRISLIWSFEKGSGPRSTATRRSSKTTTQHPQGSKAICAHVVWTT